MRWSRDICIFQNCGNGNSVDLDHAHMKQHRKKYVTGRFVQLQWQNSKHTIFVLSRRVTYVPIVQPLTFSKYSLTDDDCLHKKTWKYRKKC